MIMHKLGYDMGCGASDSRKMGRNKKKLVKLLYKMNPSKISSGVQILEPNKDGVLSKRKADIEDVVMEDAETDCRKLKRIDMGDKDSIEQVAGVGNVQPREQQ